MSEDIKDFRLFMDRRAHIAGAYVEGDYSPLDGLVARASAATFFGPGGDFVQGADSVAERYATDAASFEPGGETELEVLQMGAGEDIAYWVGFQTARAKLAGKEDLVPMKLRVTEFFRREGGEWKLVHRHADMAKTGE